MDNINDDVVFWRALAAGYEHFAPKGALTSLEARFERTIMLKEMQIQSLRVAMGRCDTRINDLESRLGMLEAAVRRPGGQ